MKGNEVLEKDIEQMDPYEGTNRDAGVSCKPEVSVVVPSYNHASFIEKTLHSIFSQVFKPSYLLVIDDGSTDGSTRIIEQVLSHSPIPCELIARPNKGLCVTLNEGLSKTKGNYFAYLGSDDLWLPNMLSARISTLEARPAAVLAYGHCFLIDENNLIIGCTQDWTSYADGLVQDMLLRQTYAPMSPTVVYRRRFLEQERWNETAKLEDYELYLRLSTLGDFAFDTAPLAAWRQHKRNTSSNFLWMIDARLAAQRRVADRLQLSQADLQHFQGILKFAGVEDLLRLGDKRSALPLLRSNWRSAPSAGALLRVLYRLIAPHSLIRWQRKRRETRAAISYGSVSLHP